MAYRRKCFLLAIWLLGYSISFSTPPPYPTIFPLEAETIPFLLLQLCIISMSPHAFYSISYVAFIKSQCILKSSGERNVPKGHRNEMWTRWIGIASA